MRHHNVMSRLVQLRHYDLKVDKSKTLKYDFMSGTMRILRYNLKIRKELLQYDLNFGRTRTWQYETYYCIKMKHYNVMSRMVTVRHYKMISTLVILRHYNMISR